MKQTKRIGSFLLAVALLLTLLPHLSLTASAASVVASGYCGNNLTWTLDGAGTLTVSGTGPMEDLSRIKTDWRTTYLGVSGYPWSSCTRLCKKIVIENGVTTIEAYAFHYFINVTSVEIGDSVTSIGECAFFACSSMTSLKLGKSVETIGENTFERCSNLTGITLPDSVLTIGDGAFSHCYDLASVDLGESVTTIGSDAFYCCVSMTEIDIPASVKTISGGSFRGCRLAKVKVDANNPDYCSKDGVLFNQDKSTLIYYPAGKDGTSYSIPNSVIRIEDYAFYDCNALKGIVIPNSVIDIGYEAFWRCSNLTKVSIPDSVIAIGTEAFESCTKLADISFPDSVTSIGANAFMGTPWLNAQPEGMVYAGKVAYEYKGSERPTEVVLKEGTLGISDGLFARWYDLTSVEIPDSVVTIGNSAFYSSGLTEIVLPGTLTTIGDSAFAYCDFTEIELPASVKIIGEDAFDGCFDLTNISVASGNPVYSSEGGVLFNKDKTTLISYPQGKSGAYTVPDTVTAIDDYAFYDCLNLTSITIPASVKSIGDGAFNRSNYNYSYSLDSVYIDDVAAWCNIAFADSSSNPLGLAGKLYVKQELAESLVIPNSVTSIGRSAFAGMKNLKKVEIPNSVTSIGNSAFWGCSNIGSIEIPNSVTSIGDSAFGSCSNIGSIEIPNSVTSIGDGAFKSCSNIRSIEIPDSVISIGNEAFRDCTGLTTVKIGASVRSIGKLAFGGCTGLKSFSVATDNSCYSSENGVLFNHSKTTLVCYPGGKTGTYAIPETVTYVGNNAFYSCAALTGVEIPKSVVSLGFEAFSGCTGLKSVELCNSLGSGAFRDCTALKSVTFDESVSSMGAGLFLECNNLEEIYFEGRAPLRAEPDVFGSLQYVTATASYHPDNSWTDTAKEEFGGTITWVALEPKVQPGDLNNDGSVDEDDAIYLLQHVLLPNLFPVSQAVDYNQDGSVDEDDAIYLLQHVLLPNLFPIS